MRPKEKLSWVNQKMLVGHFWVRMCGNDLFKSYKVDGGVWMRQEEVTRCFKPRRQQRRQS